MTFVCDTRLLIAFEFPPSEDMRQKITKLMQQSLANRLLIPSVVLTEYIKIAGRKIGIEAAVTHINKLDDRGAIVTEINREVALEAGKLSVKHSDVPIVDALLAAFATVHSAKYILTDDPHLEKLGSKTKWI